MFKYLMVLPFLVGCSDDGSGPSFPQRDPHYFPLRVGLYQVYDVEEIRYQAIGDPDTLIYELRTEVIDSFATAESYTYVIQSSKLPAGSTTWSTVDTQAVRIQENEVVVTEGNVSFLKMLWPAAPGTTWNGNRYNTIGDDEYVLDAVDVPSTINGVTFDQSMKIVQEDNDDPIVFTDLRSEIYARGVGLIYREITQLYFCVDQSCNNQNIIIDGVAFKQSIKSYGSI